MNQAQESHYPELLVGTMVTSNASPPVVEHLMTPIEELVKPGLTLARPCIRCARQMSRLSPKKPSFCTKFETYVCCRQNSSTDDAACTRCHRGKSEMFLPQTLASSYISMFNTGRAVHYALAHSETESMANFERVVHDFETSAEDYKDKYTLFCETLGDNPLTFKKAQIVAAGLATGVEIPDDLLFPLTTLQLCGQIITSEVSPEATAPPSPDCYQHMCPIDNDHEVSITKLLDRIARLELVERRRGKAVKEIKARLQHIEQRLGIEPDEDDPLLKNMDPQLFSQIDIEEAEGESR